MEILNSYQRKKIDESNDYEFYNEPRFVYHLDLNFRKYLTDIYKQEIPISSKVLDLMSSWDSYLPENKTYEKVIGHGMNEKELIKNNSLDSFWIQNFNLNQNIPLENKSIDYCLMVAAWQYLQYPEALTRDIARVLTDNGKIIVSFSNRAFWTKSPNIWTSSNEEDRIQYVRKVLISNGFNEPKVIRKFLSPKFKILPFYKSDPFYCLISSKLSE